MQKILMCGVYHDQNKTDTINRLWLHNSANNHAILMAKSGQKFIINGAMEIH